MGFCQAGHVLLKEGPSASSCELLAQGGNGLFLGPQRQALQDDAPVPRHASDPTAAAFSPRVGAEQLKRQLGQANVSPLSLYVHVPLCRHARWYCDCNRVTTSLGPKVVQLYLETLERELQLIRSAMPQRRRQAQLHWGGGTPNDLSSEEAGRLWALIDRHFDLEPDLEASIELNPELLIRDGALALRELGFNRVSFRIQDADPAVQEAVNRVVPVDQLRRAMAWQREAGSAWVNVDLICGLPLQTPERFERTLELVRKLRPDRISLFSFAYLPSQRERLRMLERAQRLFTSNGYDAIGMDHYALTQDSWPSQPDPTSCIEISRDMPPEDS